MIWGEKTQSRLRTLSLKCRGQLLTGTAFGISFVAVLETLISAKIAEQRQAALTSFREDTVAGWNPAPVEMSFSHALDVLSHDVILFCIGICIDPAGFQPLTVTIKTSLWNRTELQSSNSHVSHRLSVVARLNPNIDPKGWSQHSGWVPNYCWWKKSG